LGITKLLAKLGAVALFSAFHHCAQSKKCDEHVLHKYTHWMPGSDCLVLQGYKKSRMRTKNYCRTLLSFAA
jgi:hypothetical protein